MYCHNCGSEIDDKAEICIKCGVRVKKSSATQEKDPGVAAILSLFIIGGGQIYNGQIAKGIILMIIATILFVSIVGWIIIPFLWIYAIYDAYTTAKNMNDE